MRALATTLLLAAALAASPAYALDAPELPRIQVPPVATPDLPPLPEVPLPEVPKVPLPDVQAPLPTPAPPAVPPAVPAVPNPSVSEPASGGTGDAPARGGSQGGGARATSGPSSAAPGPARAGSGRSTPRRTSGRSADGARRRGARGDTRSSSPARSDAVVTTPETPTRRASVRTLDTRAPAREQESEPGAAARLAGDLGELVQSMPAAVLWALLGIAALALGLAGNAFWQSRQRAALEDQRAELLDDIGLLSSALLPAVPEGLNGLSVTAAYRPADGPAAGGDFYDVFALGEERIGVLLGDVSGHGRQSLTQAALARYTLRTLLAAGHSPGEALARADELLARDLRPDFVTVIVAVYDRGSDELTYAKAGHAPPIVLGTEHDPDAERPVPPIGLGVGEVWPEYRLKLGAGVSVCLFTDGLEDARLEGTRIGRGEVVRLLGTHEPPDAAQLLDDVRDLADQMSDDTAAVVLHHR